jgi:hypothetical protein
VQRSLHGISLVAGVTGRSDQDSKHMRDEGHVET